MMGIKTIGWNHKNPSDSSFVRISVIFVLIGCFVLGLDESIKQTWTGISDRVHDITIVGWEIKPI